MRETLFNWWGDKVAGARVLDLFAGSGALGFEAASRGASYVAMVEKQYSLCRKLRAQTSVLNAEDRIKVYGGDALTWLRRVGSESFDLVCIDPPFGRSEMVLRCCELLPGRGLLKQEALIYAESPAPLEPPADFTVLRQSRVGQVHGSLWQYSGDIQ